ncbi:MAG: hypothetical protein M1830_010520 [Pleopsidium flavum]|nr:MAG: hypothetical protein M1830_010520 [Pleopsidium flavum]
MFSLIFLITLAQMVMAGTVTYNWDITWVMANPDGAMMRPVIGINGQWPCPAINANVGDRVLVNVNNRLGNESTSLHFHGLFQQGSDTMDGPSGVTQCPIPPGSKFTYDFQIDQPGTYWYHSHNKGQYPDGLRGPLVVHDPASPYKNQYSEEIVITLSDWYHDQMPSLLNTYLSVAKNPDGAEPIPKSALINDSQNVKFHLTPGKTYLVRIISIAAFASHFVHFDKHPMKIVEIDGVYTEPQDADTILVTAAQRYSVLIQAHNNTQENFAFLSSMNPEMFDSVPPGLNLNVSGFLVYDDKKALPSTPLSLPTFNAYDDFGLVPQDHQALLGPVDHTVTLNADFTTINGSNRATMNERTYLEQKVPTLYTALSVGSDAQNPLVYGPNSNAFVVKSNEVVEIVLNNLDTGAHPFHLHGHQVQVVARSGAGAGTYDGKSGSFPKVPMRRDTYLVNKNGYAVVRYKADNPDKFSACIITDDRKLTNTTRVSVPLSYRMARRSRPYGNVH